MFISPVTVTAGYLTKTSRGGHIMSQAKKILLAPLDPVHDIGLKMIKRGLDQAGHDTQLLPPDY